MVSVTRSLGLSEGSPHPPHPWTLKPSLSWWPGSQHNRAAGSSREQSPCPRRTLKNRGRISTEKGVLFRAVNSAQSTVLCCTGKHNFQGSEGHWAGPTREPGLSRSLVDIQGHGGTASWHVQNSHARTLSTAGSRAQVSWSGSTSQKRSYTKNALKTPRPIIFTSSILLFTLQSCN